MKLRVLFVLSTKSVARRTKQFENIPILTFFCNFCALLQKYNSNKPKRAKQKKFSTNYANSEILRMVPIKRETAKKKVKYYVLCSFCHGLELPIGLVRHTTSPAPGLSQRNHLKSKSIAEKRHLRWALLRSTRSGFHLHLGSKRS